MDRLKSSMLSSKGFPTPPSHHPPCSWPYTPTICLGLALVIAKDIPSAVLACHIGSWRRARCIRAATREMGRPGKSGEARGTRKQDLQWSGKTVAFLNVSTSQLSFVMIGTNNNYLLLSLGFCMKFYLLF